MACYSAIEKKTIVVSPDDTVENILKVLKKNKVATVAVVDKDGYFYGTFSKPILLRNLVSVPVITSGEVQIGMNIAAAPGVAKRLGKVLPLCVTEVMERKPKTILPNEPIWEAASQLSQNGEAICVIDDNGKFMGIITYDSMVEELHNMLKIS